VASHHHDTICALATPRGDGALGVVRLSGPRASDLALKVSGREQFRPRRLHRVALVDPDDGRRVEDAMVCLMPGPHSYTGEDVVEVYGHGGARNLQAVIGLFLRLGARQAEPGEFTRRAFVNGRMDLSQAEAVAEVISARSERALRNAQAVLAGELGRRVRELRGQLVELAAELEACLDFAEEVDAVISVGKLRQMQVEVRQRIVALAQTYRLGSRLNGVSVALVGPVNSGKSSLFNSWVGSTRALVSQQEGTTRDYIEAELEWDGLCVSVIDTAGDRAEGAMSALEQAGHALGRERVARCDVRVEVVGLDGESRHARRLVQGVDVVAANKADLLSKVDVAERCAKLEQQWGTRVVATSALTGDGLGTLREAVLACVRGAGGSAEEPGEGVAVTQYRQWQALQEGAEALQRGVKVLGDGAPAEIVVEHVREALEALGRITGETYTEDVLDVVFSKFCVGK